MQTKIEIGKTSRTHGVRGELKVELFHYTPELWSPGQTVFIQEHSYEIDALRGAESARILRLKGVDSKEDAQRLTQQLILVERSQLPEEDDDEFYHQDLIGMALIEDGKTVGEVETFYDHGAQVVLVLRVGQERIELPFVSAFFPEVDKDQRTLTFVRPEYE